MIKECIADISHLPAVPPRSAELYSAAGRRMLEQVSRELMACPDIQDLIGDNPLQMVEMGLQQHYQIMQTILKLNSFDLLARMAPWIYRVFHSRGFSWDYFPLELKAFKNALLECSGDGYVRPIIAIYDWLIRHHQDMIELSGSGDTLGFALPDEIDEMQQIFTTLLLNADHGGCLKLADTSVKTPAELRHFYEHVVRHSLYTVGELWERNQISVAEEHLATAIVGRVTSFLYGRFTGTPQTKGTVVVSSAPNEFHEVGARMVADILELDGWDVTYLGANTPPEELLRLLINRKPFLLALSVATPFNLDKARLVIDAVKSIPDLAGVRILTGGLAFLAAPQIWHELGADGYAANLDELTALCDGWWRENGGQT
ncbi:MAG TPA: cobalamin B12-binding domain-containing protein [Desulfuromonadales bacterium]|nr:cobalamin B12-binding domain-containing protein [Desulfuromonadales bacterium]